MYNQQPLVNRSEKPCPVTFNPVSQIYSQEIIGRRWFQHIVHDVCHIAWLIHLFRFIQGKRRAWHCGAHTLVNRQVTCFITRLAAAKQMGADYLFKGPETGRSVNYYGGMLYGWRFKEVRKSNSHASGLIG